MEQKKTDTSDKDKTKILIVDDHWVVVEGIKGALENHEEFVVVGTAPDGLEAIERVKSLKPDVVILDISMPHLNGVEAALEIKRLDKKVRIVIFSMYSDKEYVLSLFKAGISAYVLKEEPLSNLVLAVKSAKTGGTYYSPAVHMAIREHMDNLEAGVGDAARRSEKDSLTCLSFREKEMFPLLADGLSVREIAKRLGISPKTVESHKYNIMDKLHVTSPIDLTKIALRKNLIKL